MNRQVKVIPRRDRVEKWEYYNPILKRQELVKVFFPDGTERWKIGDGKTCFVDLSYVEENKVTIDLSQDLEWGNYLIRLSIGEDEKL